MLKRYALIYYVGMIFFACFIIISQINAKLGDVQTRTRTRSMPSAGATGQEMYYPLFPLSRHPIGSINCYRVVYARTTPETARHYAGLFAMPGEHTADEDAYYFENEKGALTVYRHARQLTYVPALPLAEMPALFLEAHGLPLGYEEVRVAYDGETYSLTYVDFIDNLKNYAFNTHAELDVHGNILQIDYFFVQYEKLGSTRIMSMREAFDLLPPSEAPVTLTQGQLVYVYENSVVQPAYFFEGEHGDGTTAEYFIKAAVYKGGP
jgi:hypothetical protein